MKNLSRKNQTLCEEIPVGRSAPRPAVLPVLSLVFICPALIAVLWERGVPGKGGISFFFEIFAALPVVSALCALSAEDLCTFRVKNGHLPYLLLAGLPTFLRAGSAARARNLLFFLLYFVLYFLFGRLLLRAIGGADIKITGLLLLFSGGRFAIESLMIAFLVAAVYSFLLLACCLLKERRIPEKKKELRQALKSHLPFVPFLTFGYCFCFLLFPGGA